MIKKILYVFILTFLFATCAFAETTAKMKYFEARDFIEKGQDYFAFMNFRTVADEHPFSKWARKSEFALGEYYFAIGDFYDSVNTFDNFLRKHRKGIDILLANAYLLKIISSINYGGEEKEKANETIAKLKANIFDQEHRDLFSENEDARFVTPYASPYNNRYEIFQYLNRIEIIVNDKEFFSITP